MGNQLEYIFLFLLKIQNGSACYGAACTGTHGHFNSLKSVAWSGYFYCISVYEAPFLFEMIAIMSE